VRFEGRVDSAALNRVTKAIVNTPSRVFPPLQREFQRIGYEWERAVQDRFTGRTGPQSLRGRTGNLRRSLSAKVDGSSLGDLRLRCVSQGPNYARAQQYGAEIRPVNARHLTIPIGGNETAAGVPRYPTVGSLIAEFGKRAFFLKRPGKNTLVMLKDASSGGVAGSLAQKRNTLHKNKKGSMTPMFVLVDRVTLPGPKTTGGPSRLGFFEEFQKLAARRTIVDRVAREIGRAS
jgi:hypothetical protein